LVKKKIGTNNFGDASESWGASREISTFVNAKLRKIEQAGKRRPSNVKILKPSKKLYYNNLATI